MGTFIWDLFLLALMIVVVAWIASRMNDDNAAIRKFNKGLDDFIKDPTRYKKGKKNG